MQKTGRLGRERDQAAAKRLGTASIGGMSSGLGPPYPHILGKTQASPWGIGLQSLYFAGAKKPERVKLKSREFF